MKDQKGQPVAIASPTMPAVETQQRLSDLFAMHHRRVLMAAYRITGSMADAEDVAQSVFLRLTAGDELAVNNAGSYLYRAAINGGLDLLRRRNTAASEPLDLAADVASQGRGSRPEAEAASSELVQWLRTELAELSPRAAEMFTLRYVEELDNREIAALMHTSQGGGGGNAAPGAIKAEEAAHRDGTGEPMKNQDEMLDKAIKSMREAEPEAGQLSAAAEKVAGKLGIAFADNSTVESCEEMRPLLDAYRAGTLSENRALLVKAHLRECGVCLRRFHSGSGAVDWSAPKVMPAHRPVRPWAMTWAMAASLALAATGLFVYKAYWQVPARSAGRGAID